MHKNARFVILIIVLIATAVLLYLISKRNQQAASETPDMRVFSGDGILTATPSADITPMPTRMIPTMPAPHTGMSNMAIADPYFGGYIGDLVPEKGQSLKVYAPAYDLNGTLLIPDDGLVLWAGNFIGHLIQPHGWLLVELGETFTWTPTNNEPLVLQVESSSQLYGFNLGINPGIENEYNIVTCYIDFSQSTPQKRVFGGNVIYKLSEKLVDETSK